MFEHGPLASKGVCGSFHHGSLFFTALRHIVSQLKRY
jgi:hypothetical protein